MIEYAHQDLGLNTTIRMPFGAAPLFFSRLAAWNIGVGPVLEGGFVPRDVW